MTVEKAELFSFRKAKGAAQPGFLLGALFVKQLYSNVTKVTGANYS
jgi:hypothetical protein